MSLNDIAIIKKKISKKKKDMKLNDNNIINILINIIKMNPQNLKYL